MIPTEWHDRIQLPVGVQNITNFSKIFISNVAGLYAMSMDPGTTTDTVTNS